MPNWTFNLISFKTKQDFETFRKHAIKKGKNGEDTVSFSVLIPRPKDLDIISGSDSYSNQYKRTRDLLTPHLVAEYNQEISLCNYIDAVLKRLEGHLDGSLIKADYDDIVTPISGYFNSRRYGYEDWWSWSCDKWGTKWDACDVYIDEENLNVSFNTAWCNPEPWIQELAKKVDFVHSYQDEAESFATTNLYMDGELLVSMEQNDEE